EENDWLSKKWSDLPQIECKKCCISEKAMVESIFKQTVILKNGNKKTKSTYPSLDFRLGSQTFTEVDRQVYI
ncbi:hypothetical protein MJI43_24115, partial [Salmonella enterica subsp. enterica serovar Anatum]|nr:hypothetical protein [Salmonella enterica subsp. enterica serovar Anatum]